jgi:hypothetical protein
VNRHESDDRLGLLALGSLPAAEARELESHVAGCATCRAELAELRDAVALLPLAVDPEMPPAHVRSGLFERLDAGSTAARRDTAWSPLAWSLAAALVLALLGDGYFATRAPSAQHSDDGSQTARDEAAGLRAALVRERARTVALRAALADARRPRATPGNAPASAALLAALQTGRVYSVDGVVNAEAWHCTVVQPASGGNAYIVTQTPNAKAGFVYHAWVLRAGRVFDAATLAPRLAQAQVMPMPLARGDVVAFSLEPSGGIHPSTPFLMRVTISG